jgi:asparagine synthetase B (glutamine-hydrolysing)
VFFRLLDGVFAIVIVDKIAKTVTIGRDPYGVRPLFVGQRLGLTNSQTGLHVGALFSSEIKGMWPIIQGHSQFPPGTCQIFNIYTFVCI